jgi:aminoglycoside phosphotransferase (APT) family kinase protein
MKPTLPEAGLATGTPLAEYSIGTTLVSRLLAEQHPDLAHLPLCEVEPGWDNAIFRLGDQLAVRLPRRAKAATLIVHEQQWLPRLSEHLSFPAPVPHRSGKPSLGYPCAWSVVPWLNGKPADLNKPVASQAGPFGRFLRSLHACLVTNAPLNPLRGVPLQQRAHVVEPRLDRLARRTSLITSRIRQIWRAALEAPLARTPVFLRGDLHPCNVLVDRGIIAGIIDWGDMTSGDPATDLASSWMLFDDPEAQREVLSEYGDVPEPTLQRAKGWAVLFGVLLLETGLNDNPRHASLGESILHRVSLGA